MKKNTNNNRPAPHTAGFATNPYPARFIEDLRIGDQILKNGTYVFVIGTETRGGEVYTIRWAYRADATKHVGFHVGKVGAKDAFGDRESFRIPAAA